VKVKTVSITNGHVGDAAIGKSTCTGNGVTEVGCYSSSSPHLPSLTLKRVEYQFTPVNKKVFGKIPCRSDLEPGTFNGSDMCSNH